MFNFFRKLIGFFSLFAHPIEKRADKFLQKITPNTGQIFIHNRVLELMKEDLIIFDLWLERRYKGYKYLRKSRRKKMYENVAKMKIKLDDFCSKEKLDDEKILDTILKKKIIFRGGMAKLKYLACLMSFFSGKNGCFEYEKSSNFGKLLKDPAKGKVIGDCNQIVTLYAYFFGLKYNLEDLRIKVYPGHVCLHYAGVDIETTNGTFQNYRKKNQKILPITELMAVNLLDISDANERMYKVSPKAFLEAAELTYLISSDREIADHNLKTAQQSLVQHLVKENNFAKAKKIAKQSNDSRLVTSVIHSEAIHYYKQKRFKKALVLFQEINQKKNVEACYGALYQELNKSLKTVKTVKQLKAKKPVLRKMEEYARKSNNPRLMKHVQDLLRQV